MHPGPAFCHLRPLQRAHLSALVTPIVEGVQQRLQEKAAADAGAGVVPAGVTRQKLIWVFRDGLVLDSGRSHVHTAPRTQRVTRCQRSWTLIGACDPVIMHAPPDSRRVPQDLTALARIIRFSDAITSRFQPGWVHRTSRAEPAVHEEHTAILLFDSIFDNLAAVQTAFLGSVRHFPGRFSPF